MAAESSCGGVAGSVSSAMRVGKKAVRDGHTHLAARNVQASVFFNTGRSITCTASCLPSVLSLVDHTQSLVDDVPMTCARA